MDNQQVTREEIGWLAGIWDGEGTISVRRNNAIGQISPRMHIVNTNMLIIEKVVEILGNLDIRFYIAEKGQGGFEGSNRQCYIIGVQTMLYADKLINILYPYLIGKRVQAKLLKSFLSSRLNRKVVEGRNCKYNDMELESIEKLYLSNGNQRGSSETIREMRLALAKNRNDIVQALVKASG